MYLFFRSRAWFSSLLSAMRFSVHCFVAWALSSSRVSASFLIASTACIKTAMQPWEEADTEGSAIMRTGCRVACTFRLQISTDDHNSSRSCCLPTWVGCEKQRAQCVTLPKAVSTSDYMHSRSLVQSSCTACHAGI